MPSAAAIGPFNNIYNLPTIAHHTCIHNKTITSFLMYVSLRLFLPLWNHPTSELVTLHPSIASSQNQLLEPSYASHCALKFAALQRKAEPAVVWHPGPGAAAYAQPSGPQEGFPDVVAVELALEAVHL